MTPKELDRQGDDLEQIVRRALRSIGASPHEAGQCFLRALIQLAILAERTFVELGRPVPTEVLRARDERLEMFLRQTGRPFDLEKDAVTWEEVDRLPTPDDN